MKTPQANGQVEAMNKKILAALKKKVDNAKGSWLEELLGIIWALRTSPHTAMREMPFSLVYGAKAVILVEIGLRLHKTSHFNEDANQEVRRLNLDLINEVIEALKVRNTV